MVTMRREGKVKIEILADHNPPHFHVISPDSGFMVDLHSFAVIRGSGSGAELTEAVEWAKANAAVLLAKWREINGLE